MHTIFDETPSERQEPIRSIVTLPSSESLSHLGRKQAQLSSSLSYRIVMLKEQVEDISSPSTLSLSKKSLCSFKEIPQEQLSMFKYDLLQDLLAEVQIHYKQSDMEAFMGKFDMNKVLSKSTALVASQQHKKVVYKDILPKMFDFGSSFAISIKANHLGQMRKALKNILYLYLNGDYRGMNESNHHVNSLYQKALLPLENPQGSNKKNTRYVSYKYKSKHINFDCVNLSSIKTEDDEVALIQEKDDTDPVKKQVIYNKSKYMMQFMMRLLQEDHLSLIEIPPGLDRRIKEITNKTKESSKHNKLSQSLFYNHSHFDCLFLQIRPMNVEYMKSNTELVSLHELIFDLKDLRDVFSVNTANLYKHILAQAIMAQVTMIRQEIIPNIPTHTLSFKSISKLKYFERICDSIAKLNEGTIITKF